MKSSKSRSKKKAPKNSIPQFLEKTYRIVNKNEFGDIVHWNSQGDSFVIESSIEFSQHVLPKYFKHNNFSSYVRQLNMYGFSKVNKQGSGKHQFMHKHFRRGKKSLLCNIKRKKNDTRSKVGVFAKFLKAQAKAAKSSKKGGEFEKDFFDDYQNMKRRLDDVEKNFDLLITHYGNLLEDNKRMYLEIVQSREEFDKKIELLVIMVFGFMGQKKNFYNSNQVAKEGKNPKDANLGGMPKNLYSLVGINPKDKNNIKNHYLEDPENYLHSLIRRLTSHKKKDHTFDSFCPTWLKVQPFHEKLKEQGFPNFPNILQNGQQQSLNNFTNQIEQATSDDLQSLLNKSFDEAPIKVELESSRGSVKGTDRNYAFPSSPHLGKRRKTSVDSFSLHSNGGGNESLKKLKLPDPLNHSLEIMDGRSNAGQFNLNHSREINLDSSILAIPHADLKLGSKQVSMNLLDSSIMEPKKEDLKDFLDMDRISNVDSLEDLQNKLGQKM